MVIAGFFYDPTFCTKDHVQIVSLTTAFFSLSILRGYLKVAMFVVYLVY